MTKEKYLKAAELIVRANFSMAGYGYFNVSRIEMAQIIQLAMEGKDGELRQLYEKLSYERLG